MEAWCAAVHGGHKEQLTTVTFAIFYPLKENHRSCPHSRAGDNKCGSQEGDHRPPQSVLSRVRLAEVESQPDL